MIDKTGLTGSFDIQLEWAPDSRAGDAATSDASGPSLFTAIEEQLGLRLESTKGLVDVVVIDSAQKLPQDAGMLAPNGLAEATSSKTAGVLRVEGRSSDKSRATSLPPQLASLLSMLPAASTPAPAATFEVASIKPETRARAGVDMFSGTWILNVAQTNKANEESGAGVNQGRGFTGPNTEEIQAER